MEKQLNVLLIEDNLIEIMKMKSRDDSGQASQKLSTPLTAVNQNPWIQDPFGKKTK